MSNGSGRENWWGLHLWEIAAVRDIVVLLFGVLVCLVAFWLRDVLVLFLLAFAIAYVVKPLVDLAEDNYAIPRVVSSAAIVVLGIGTFVGAMVYFAPIIVEQSRDLATRVPDMLSAGLESAGIPADEAEERVRKEVDELKSDPRKVADQLASVAASALGYLGRFVDHVSYLSTAAFIVPVYVFYFAWRYDAFLDGMKSFIPVGPRDRVLELFSRFDDTFGRFVRGRIAVGLAQVVLFSFGFWLVDIPFWFLIGVFTGLLSIVPIIGFVGWPLAILAKSLEGGDWMDVLVWPTVVYGIVQAIEVWLLTPWVIGRSLDISPFMVLFAIMVGGAVGGLFGVLLAVPLANCFAIVYAEEVKPRLDEWSRDAAGG